MDHNIFSKCSCKNIDGKQISYKGASAADFVESAPKQNLAPTSVPPRKVINAKYVLLFVIMVMPIFLLGCRGIAHQKEKSQSLTSQKAETKENQKDSRNISEPLDNEIESYEDGNGKYGYKLKTTGEILIPAKYDHSWPFREGLAHVRLNGKFGFVDKSGNEIIPLKYDMTDFFSEGLTIVELNGKYGFIDKTGKVVIPFIYDGGFTFKDGLAVVELDGKFGYIDKTGKEIIPLKYDWAWSFSDGKAKVKLNGEEFYIDKNGNRIEE